MEFNVLERKGRITVVSQVTYQTAGKTTTSVVSRYSLPVLEDEQRYEKPPYKAGEEWVVLDPGWVKTPGMIVIQNDKRSSWLEVGISLGFENGPLQKERVESFLEIPPGGEFRGIPYEFVCIRVRAKKGEGKFTVNVFPK